MLGRNPPSQGFQELFSYAAADGVIVYCARKRGHKAKQKHESLQAGWTDSGKRSQLRDRR